MLTHQTSPRFIGCVTGQGFRPFLGFGLAAPVLRHCPVGLFQLVIDNGRASQRIQKFADAPGPDLGVKAFIDFLGNRDRESSPHPIRI
jgi:hypothetical protein